MNYMLLRIAFGDQGHADGMRTLELFDTEVMPAIAWTVSGFDGTAVAAARPEGLPALRYAPDRVRGYSG